MQNKIIKLARLAVLGCVSLLGILAAPLSAQAQICRHGIGAQMNVFGTNCVGTAVAGVALRGSTVGFVISANYLDQCGSEGGGDKSVVTNITIASSVPCDVFNTPNLINTNGVPAGNIVDGKNVLLEP